MRKNLLILPIISLLIVGASFIQNPVTRPSVLSVYDENGSVFARFLPKFASNDLQVAFNTLTNSADAKSGTYGIYVKNLFNQQAFTFNETELFYAASLYKTPIAAATMREIEQGDLSFDDPIVYSDGDYSSGTGTINKSPYGTEFTVDYVLDRLLKDSDNVAQVMLLRSMSENAVMAGFNLIEIKNNFYNNNTLTPEQSVNFYERLVLSDFISTTNREILLNKMAQTSFDDRISTGLANDTKFSHKIGNWGQTGSWHDCGIVSKGLTKIAVCVMSRHTTYEEFLQVSKETGEFINQLL